MSENEKEIIIEEEVTLGEDKRVYELGYHLVPTLSDDDVTKAVSDIKALILKNGGVFISEGAPKLMALSYTFVIKVESRGTRFDKAHFGWIKFEMGGDEVLTFKEAIDLETRVLRSLMVRAVREDTMQMYKRTMFDREPKSDVLITTIKKLEKKEEQVPVSEEELDKSIEKLIK